MFGSVYRLQILWRQGPWSVIYLWIHSACQIYICCMNKIKYRWCIWCGDWSLCIQYYTFVCVCVRVLHRKNGIWAKVRIKAERDGCCVDWQQVGSAFVMQFCEYYRLKIMKYSLMEEQACKNDVMVTVIQSFLSLCYCSLDWDLCWLFHISRQKS